MCILKEEEAITMVALTITVIVLIILSGISINIGIGQIERVKDSKLKTELEMVQHAILEQYTKYKTTKDIEYLVGNEITDEEAASASNELGVTLVDIPDTYSNKGYYRLDKALLDSIGIRDSSDEYIINYISGEVMNITAKRLSNDDPLYTKANSF